MAHAVTEKMMEESMAFDVHEAAAAGETDIINTNMLVDEEMIAVPPAECSSLFSMCLPQNSLYFQNIRQIENSVAYIKRTKTFHMYEQN